VTYFVIPNVCHRGLPWSFLGALTRSRPHGRLRLCGDLPAVEQWVVWITCCTASLPSLSLRPLSARCITPRYTRQSPLRTLYRHSRFRLVLEYSQRAQPRLLRNYSSTCHSSVFSRHSHAGPGVRLFATTGLSVRRSPSAGLSLAAPPQSVRSRLTFLNHAPPTHGIHFSHAIPPWHSPSPAPTCPILQLPSTHAPITLMALAGLPTCPPRAAARLTLLTLRAASSLLRYSRTWGRVTAAHRGFRNLPRRLGYRRGQD